MNLQDLGALARAIVDSNIYMTLATADESGRPWASPVWHAPAEDYAEFLIERSRQSTGSWVPAIGGYRSALDFKCT